VRTILLNPGPVTLSAGVRAATLAADLCHREPEFLQAQSRVIDGLLAVYGCDGHWRAVTHGGSGTSAMEAMLVSLLPADARLLVLENGVYGERLAKIAEIYGIACDSLRVAWGAPLDLAAVQARLEQGGFSHLAMVHHETTTGRLNPVTEIADLCARHGVRLLLDAVSSFGAEDIPFSHPALEACAGTANKCLHGIPGLAFVLCREAALQAGARRSLSLHLPDWAARQQAGSTPYTPAVPAVLALQQALAELAAQGGAQARRARYLQLADAVRHTLLDLGVTPWLPPEESSCVLRSYRLPAGVAYNSVHAALKRDGFIIYEGQGGLAQEMFRISTMGDITDGDAERLQASLVKVFGG
jgi:2-aminoethylphosphonate-pyruvate transaminase